MNRIGSNVLHYAASHEPLARFLPRLGESLGGVDITDNTGSTPLMMALIRGCVSGARVLLDLGADPLATDERGSSVIHHFVDGIYGFREDREQPENLDLLRDLISLGVDPLKPGNYGQHAVSIAGRKGLDLVLAVFLDAGIDISKKDNNDVTAMMAAACAGKYGTARRLVKGGEPLDLVSAVCLGELDAVRIHFEQGQVDLNELWNPDSASFLSMAIYHGHVAIVSYLLDSGADPSGRTTYGGSTLHNAIRGLPDPGVITRLIDLGAEVDATDGDLNTPLNFAARDNKLEIARLLLKAGADPQAKTERGYPVSDFAKSDEMIKLLSKFKALAPKRNGF